MMKPKVSADLDKAAIAAKDARRRIDLALSLIGRTDDIAQLDSIALNAGKKGVDEVVDAAVRRKLKLAGRDYSDPLEQEMQEAIAAREHVLVRKLGKGQKAGLARRMLDRGRPVRTVVADWILDAKPVAGFKDFAEAGIPEFAAENIAIRHGSEFPPEVVEAAKRHVEEYTASR